MAQTQAPPRPAPSAAEGERSQPPAKIEGSQASQASEKKIGPKELRAFAAALGGEEGSLKDITNEGDPEQIEKALEAVAKGGDDSRQAGMAIGRDDDEDKQPSLQEQHETRVKAIRLEGISLDIPSEVLTNPQFSDIYTKALQENSLKGNPDLKTTGISALTIYYNTPEGGSVLKSDQQFIKKKQEIVAQFEKEGKQVSTEDLHKASVSAYVKEKYGEVSEARKDPYKTTEERRDADYRARRVVADNLLIQQLDVAIGNPILSDEKLRVLMQQRDALKKFIYDQEYYNKPSNNKDRWIMLLTFIAGTLINEGRDWITPGQDIR